MVRFMVVTFAFLAWAFYLMSGGADFDPDRARLDGSRSDPLKSAAVQPAVAEPPSTDIEVTRVSLNLTSVEDVLNPDEETPNASRQPQLSEQAAQSETGSGNVRIIPSLVENASPEGAFPETDAAAASIATESLSLDTNANIRVVSGNRVNVRGGPGTTYGVVGTLIRGDRVEVLDESGTGWVRMRVTDGGTVGWIADFLLTDG